MSRRTLQECAMLSSNHRYVTRSFATGLALLCTVGAFALIVVGQAAALEGSTTTRVWFVHQGEPVSVARTVKGIPGVVDALLSGPTKAERARGISTAIPARTPLISVGVQKRIVTVNLGGKFAMGVDKTSLRDRVGQLIRTLRAVPGITAVKVRIEGGIPVGLFPGYDLGRAVSEPLVPEQNRAPTVRETQQLLIDLGFMDRSGLTGEIDSQTSTAVLGFEKWSGLTRDGILSAATIDAISRATRPEPALRAPGRRIEVQLGRQVALLIENGRVERVVHISSGAYGKTPQGSFHVLRKERYSWSVPFKVWLPWASYFTGSVAFHEFGSVPTYAASHGCVRVNHYDAPILYDFATLGTQVDVFSETDA
jgi:L,D-transpeptidase catalytic domain/Sporulation and spore germination/Putative peptidoglycan binding domain